jgi:hypothetical protein
MHSYNIAAAGSSPLLVSRYSERVNLGALVSEWRELRTPSQRFLSVADARAAELGTLTPEFTPAEIALWETCCRIVGLRRRGELIAAARAEFEWEDYRGEAVAAV